MHQRPLGCGRHLLGSDPREAPEVARFTGPLPARPARERPRVHRLREPPAIPPWHRAFGKRRAEHRDDRRPGRRRDVEGTAIASNVHRRAACECPKLADVELPM